MNKKICPGCGWKNTKNASICPDCGELLDIEETDLKETPFKMPELNKKRKAVITLLVVIFMSSIIIAVESYSDEKDIKYLEGQICSSEIEQIQISGAQGILMSRPDKEAEIVGYLKDGECYNIRDQIDLEDKSIWFFLETANGTTGYLLYDSGDSIDSENTNEQYEDITTTTTTRTTTTKSADKNSTTTKKTTSKPTSNKQVLNIGEIEGINENFTSGVMTCKITALSFELSKQNYSEILTINITGKMKAPKEENDGRICNANLLFYDSENNLIAKHMIMAGPLSGGEESEFRTFTFADVDYSKIKGPLINVKIEPFTFN